MLIVMVIWCIISLGSGAKIISLRKMFRVDFSELLSVYKKLFSVSDTNLLEIILSHYVSHHLEERNPVWLFIVAPSSFGKTFHIKPFEDFPDVYLLNRITSRTLVSGQKNETDEVVLMNKKLILIPDFSQFLCLHPQEKQMIWSQFRDLYDGYAVNKYGSGKRTEYKDLYVSMLACTTPDIDNQITLFQQLGTRHIFYRADYWISKNLDYLLENVDGNYILQQYRNTIHMFFETNNFDYENLPELDRDTLAYVKKLSEFVSIFRADVHADSFSGEPIGFTYPEDPDRIFNMLKKMLISYLIISEGNLERGKQLIKEIAMSCIDERRYRIFKSFKDLCYVNGTLDDTAEVTLSQVANKVKLGLKTVKTQLYTLAQLGFLDFYEMEENPKRVIKWSLTEKGIEWLDWF